MKVGNRIGGALVASALTLLLVAPPAQAVLSSTQKKCFESIAKGGEKFAKKKQKAIAKCNDKNQNTPGDCLPADLTADIAELVVKLGEDIDKKCATLNIFDFGNMGFPGKCVDPNPGNGFTLTDLKDCIHNSHESIVDTLIDIEYGTTVPQIPDSDTRKCQAAIAKNGGKFADGKLKAIQKCRNDLNKDNLSGFAPRSCAIVSTKAQAAIAKAESKARAGILNKCTTPAQVQALDICSRPECGAFCGSCTPTCAADCIIATHGDAVDNTSQAATANLINFEYADPLTCGDGILNSTVDASDLDEECDGAAGACPGMCGAADGAFPCLCLNKKRQRVLEHKNGDADSGWTGISHDSQNSVETGGYLVDLYECDNVTDFDCIVGPNCSDPPHAPCSNDAQCNLLGQGTCRKERTAAGPHCNLDVKVTCAANSDCPGTGNYCVPSLHGPPLPLSAGGVSVCIANFFTSEITGTTNLATGAGAVSYTHDAASRLGANAVRPCPVCGDFCDGSQTPCTTNADCAALPGAPVCVTDHICSAGSTNAGKDCRPDPPYGGSSTLFGTTSVDCPPIGTIIAHLTMAFDPRTTGNATLLPSVQCDAPGFGNKTCAGGANNGRTCTASSECPGASCEYQCFCPGGGTVKEKPNGCNAACLGGTNNAEFCTVDSECPGGFCHPADCRLNPADPDGDHEGVCPTGPLNSVCSTHAQLNCDVDADCRPPLCSFCGGSETCVFGLTQCFENTGIIRDGVADPVNPTTVATACVAQTTAPSVNIASGLPGPNADRWRETRINTGF